MTNEEKKLIRAFVRNINARLLDVNEVLIRTRNLLAEFARQLSSQ